MLSEFQIEYFVTKNGSKPLIEWLDNLDFKTMNIITNRIKRIQYGTLGDCKSLGQGLYELRIHYEAGYRVYFTYQADKVILLIAGGVKKTQQSDIKKAQDYLKQLHTKKE